MSQTMRELILWGEQQLENAGVYFGHGTDNALDEAAYLMSYARHISPDFSEQVLDEELSEAELEYYKGLIDERIQKKIPAAYLVHEAWFAGLPFYVDERVLVPRSPISELIMEGFAPWIDINKVHKVLDLCTGSGCIGIAIASHFPHLHVDISDVSHDALDVANKNIDMHQVAGRVTAYHSDLFSDLPARKYDLIVSNPPYVDARDMADLPEEYRHEPQMGLTAGEQGLDLVIPMLQQAARFLQPGGILVIEVGNSEVALQERFPQVPFTWLEFEYGGHGVFLLDYDQLMEYQEEFNNEKSR
ncbi:MAG: 50S ribosomal protein L3 N(5)-glutamine methyltransferase [Gammaproteobacteria bacterium]